MKRYLIFAVVGLVLLTAFYWGGRHLFADNEKDAPIPFQLGDVKRGEIFSRITTTGTVNPIGAVTVSTQVSGTIQELRVDVNSVVKEGDVIAKLDQDLFHAEVLQARAKVEDALANLAREKAGVKMQQDQIAAGIAQTEASYKYLEEKHKRAEQLFHRNLISKEEYDDARTELEMARARFQESSARVDEAEVKKANILAAEAKVKMAEAELKLAQVKLDRSVIRSPVSGMVITKNVEAGQTVAASLQSPPLVTIADLTTMKVDAWVDEADIGKVQVDQEVEFQVDSFPGRLFTGKVVKIYPSPQIQNNVVTYDTEIHVSNEDLALKPGMTANVTIIQAKKDGVLIAPHSSLRIRRSEIRKVYDKVDEGRSRSSRRRRSTEERAARERQRFLEGRGSVWVYRDGKPERVRIRFGVTDAKNMEVKEGLKEGDKVIVGIRADAVVARSPGGSRRSWIRTRILGGF